MDLTTKNSDILKGDKIIIDFWAPWCGPCVMLAPTIESVAEETNTVLVKCNIEDFPEMATEYGVMSIPTVIIMEKGIIKKEFVGVRPKQLYLDALK